jgi:hypothetical protein
MDNVMINDMNFFQICFSGMIKHETLQQSLISKKLFRRTCTGYLQNIYP